MKRNERLDRYIDMFVNCHRVDTRWQQYSTHLHVNNTQNNTINLGRMSAVPVFASYTLAFALQLRKKHGENSVSVEKLQSK